MNHTHMQSRCPGSHFIAPALLRDYRLDFLYPSTSFPGGGAADIVEEPGSVVWGVLWEITESDAEKLDLYEDVSLGGYRRKQVHVESLGVQKDALTYEVCSKIPETMPPREDYLQLMLQGARESALPAEYIVSLGEH